jgi:hypothetical protein
MSDSVFETEKNGDARDGRGRFVDFAGPGRPPGSSRQRELRNKLMEAIGEGDITGALGVLRGIAFDPKARAGDRLRAAVEILDRGTGRVTDPDLSTLIQQAEELLAAQEAQR